MNTHFPHGPGLLAFFLEQERGYLTSGGHYASKFILRRTWDIFFESPSSDLFILGCFRQFFPLRHLAAFDTWCVGVTVQGLESPDNVLSPPDMCLSPMSFYFSSSYTSSYQEMALSASATAR